MAKDGADKVDQIELGPLAELGAAAQLGCKIELNGFQNGHSHIWGHKQ